MKVGPFVSREYEIVELLRGKPNIVPTKGTFYTEDETGRLVQNILFEYCDQGTLLDYIEKLADSR